MGAIHFCLPWPGSDFSVTRRTPTRSNAWTSRVTALRSRLNFRARSVMEPGAALTCLSRSTRLVVRACSSDSVSSKATTRLGGIGPPRSARRASLRPRSKNASAGSTRISVFRMFCLFYQFAPFSLKTRLDLPKAVKPHGGHSATEMTVVLAVGRIIAQHPTIVARVDKGVNVGEVIANDAASIIDPDFPAENAATFRLRWIMPFIGGFPGSGSHDPRYHICCVGFADRVQGELPAPLSLVEFRRLPGPVPNCNHGDKLPLFIDLANHAVDMRLPAVEQMSERPPGLIRLGRRGRPVGRAFQAVNGFLKPVIPTGSLRRVGSVLLEVKAVEIAGGPSG